MLDHYSEIREKRILWIQNLYLGLALFLYFTTLIYAWVSKQFFLPIYRLDSLAPLPIILYGLGQDMVLIGLIFVPKGGRVWLAMGLLFSLALPHLVLCLLSLGQWRGVVDLYFSFLCWFLYM